MATPLAATDPPPPSFPLAPSIGQPVRVRLSDGSSSSYCRATVAYVDAGEGIVDVVYEDREWGREEESQVAFTRLRALEPFEAAEEEDGEEKGADAAALALAVARRWREDANVLFRLGDYGAAMGRYRGALRRLLVCSSAAGADTAGEGGCCAGLRVGRLSNQCLVPCHVGRTNRPT